MLATRACFAALIVVVLQSSACSSHGSSDDGQLELVGGSKVDVNSMAKPNVGQQRPVTVSTYQVCSHGGPATVRSVELVRAENMRVVAWGLRPYPPPTPTTDEYFGTLVHDKRYSHRSVDTACGDDDAPSTELAVTLESSGRGVAVTHGLTVRASGSAVFMPYRIILCPAVCPRPVVDERPLP